MSVFQLYKKRDFSTYIGDTMQFLKQFGKNFFRNYLVINGALLLVVCVIYYFLFKESMGNIFTPQKAANSWLMSNNNFGLLISFGAIFMIVMILFSIFTIAYPMVYIKLVDNTDRDTFTSSELFAEIKDYAGRILLFGVISFFTLVPLLVIIMALGIALSFILIGIPILLLSIPTMMAWAMQSIYVYLEEETGYFEALGRGWKITFSNYWSIIGSTMALLVCVSILGSTVSMIPSIMTLSSMISTGGHASPVAMSPLMIIIYIVGLIISYVLYNILYVHQGIIYYSSLEDSEHYQAYSDIDNIGKDEE
jgi:hypothetical protein